jgi:hypothetical protein
MTRIHKIWLQQPIAFARVGGSHTPVPAFRWSDKDLRPRGTAKTMIVPAPTFSVDEKDGKLVPEPEAASTLLKDETGIRPVCPFFELHGEWEGQADTRITDEVIRDAGLHLSDLTWSIHHANHKAYSLTHADGDRIEARLTVRGNDHALHCLDGRSPEGAVNPLVPAGRCIVMGKVQVIRPTQEHRAVRLRFYAPPGHAYAPTNLQERLTTRRRLIDHLIALSLVNARWNDFKLPDTRTFLNPEAAWPQYKLLTYGQLGRAIPRIVTRLRSFIALARHRQVQMSEIARFLIGPTADAGKLPPGLFASKVGDGAVLSSLGIVDDLGDGILTCTLSGVTQPARARIVVAPPHFSPDRRPPVSIADNLTDREMRHDVRQPGWSNGENWRASEAEIDDLLDRAFETEGLSNLDAWNKTLRSENISDAVYRGDANPPRDPKTLLWRDLRAQTVLNLPLTEQGRWRHRRNSSDEFFEQLIRDDRELVEKWIRTPDDDQSLYYDRRMPALMRGSDRRPLHLTRRQLEAFKKWVAELRRRQDGERP